MLHTRLSFRNGPSHLQSALLLGPSSNDRFFIGGVLQLELTVTMISDTLTSLSSETGMYTAMYEMPTISSLLIGRPACSPPFVFLTLSRWPARMIMYQYFRNQEWHHKKRTRREEKHKTPREGKPEKTSGNHKGTRRNNTTAKIERPGRTRTYQSPHSLFQPSSWGLVPTVVPYSEQHRTAPSSPYLQTVTAPPSFSSPIAAVVVNLIRGRGLNELQRDHIPLTALGIHVPSVAFRSRMDQTWQNGS